MSMQNTFVLEYRLIGETARRAIYTPTSKEAGDFLKRQPIAAFALQKLTPKEVREHYFRGLHRAPLEAM